MLVACSGGTDSSALLHVLWRLDELELDLHAASVDHGLRAGASGDVAVARGLAERFGVPFACLEVRVPGGASVQAQAREARYRALLEHAAALGATRVAVGHTQDDQAETVLSRLLRGAGLTGLAGIMPLRPDGVVRPLIDAPRSAVRAHVARFELPHVADPSNRDPRFSRTRIRETLLPALAAENRAITAHLARLADEARVLEGWLDVQADRGDAELYRLPPVVRDRALARWVRELTGRPAKRAHIEGLNAGAEVLLPGGWVARRAGDRPVARRDSNPTTRSHRPKSGKTP